MVEMTYLKYTYIGAIIQILGADQISCSHKCFLSCNLSHRYLSRSLCPNQPNGHIDVYVPTGPDLYPPNTDLSHIMLRNGGVWAKWVMYLMDYWVALAGVTEGTLNRVGSDPSSSSSSSLLACTYITDIRYKNNQIHVGVSDRGSILGHQCSCWWPSTFRCKPISRSWWL